MLRNRQTAFRLFIIIFSTENSRQEILEALSLQRQRCEVSRGLQQSKEWMDLVLLGLYVHLPPSRGQEIRTLIFFDEEIAGAAIDLKKDYAKQNVLACTPSGIVLHLQSYKTVKFRGHDRVEIKVCYTAVLVGVERLAIE